MKIIYALMTTFFIWCKGDLLTYSLVDEIDIETAQQVLNAFIPSAPVVEYDLEMYSII